jgi:16S rRNA (guanine966-N2)-methyltransferase
MRITGGAKRGYTFKIRIGNLGIRPAKDFVRQAVFNIVRDEVEGACAMDLYAGTGLVGMEALSRGASFCLFVDSNRRAVALVKRNLGKAELSARARVVKFNAERIGAYLETDDTEYDLIFIDPPYARSDTLSVVKGVGKIFADLAASDRIRKGALLIMEQRKRSQDLPAIDGLVREDARIYGDSKVSFFRKQ